MNTITNNTTPLKLCYDNFPSLCVPTYTHQNHVQFANHQNVWYFIIL